MMKLVLLLALCAMTYAGYGGGYGGGWGWRPYYGWASVHSYQTPYSYNYGLQEHGNGYSKWISQAADTHHSTPVYGHGHGYY
ncbi:unnamed protein product [Allacma fusca]|uniref:Uncharacterized protein n=1 Tax=Allacma fusca TaxID=39272 RepID=A0A8J2JUM7_9HEXA|nr:unnamed protein product [Allacma fusca]